MKQLSAENNPGEELEHSQVSNSEDKWERREEKKEEKENAWAPRSNK
jgi:hypothetical protein